MLAIKPFSGKLRSGSIMKVWQAGPAVGWRGLLYRKDNDGAGNFNMKLILDGRISLKARVKVLWRDLKDV
jgi:hypothetical protein